MRMVTPIVLMFCSSVSYAATPVGTTRYDFKVGAHPGIALRSDGGSVTIVAGPPGAVHVEADKRDEGGDVEVKLEGDTVRIVYRAPTAGNHHGVDFRVTAPAGAKVEAHTGGGAMQLHGLGGGVDLDSGGGSIEVTDLHGNVHLHTGGGSIRAERCDGTIDAETGGGSIHVDANLHGRNHLETSGGSIQVALPASSRLAVVGSTGAGGIHNDFGLPVEGHVSRQMNGRIGDGSGGSLDLRTGAGSISLTRN